MRIREVALNVVSPFVRATHGFVPLYDIIYYIFIRLRYLVGYITPLRILEQNDNFKAIEIANICERKIVN